MTITIKNTVEQEVEIPVPCFWIDDFSETIKEYVGLLDEKTLVRVWVSPSRLYIENTNAVDNHSKIAECHRSFDLSTEAVFFAAFEAAHAKLNLQPVLQ